MQLALTEQGREVTAGAITVVDGLLQQLPAEDLAVAGRVLSLITERADAELAILAKWRPAQVVEY
ncbi:hypothetical protein GCM10010313_06340 [Streptomyces violarus]|uniref:Uncharacterized protein n=1 Tax=Streptomyces violarus TaxID=67380 RepID=A0A7W4ZKI3_9ACTN|nr:hypothetical protein [Streptomyces violarus]GHC98073.1 hypothetical protein GCM10010313_06340 [Streptomyces violarus]